MILLGGGRRSGRVMIAGIMAWYLALAVFAPQESKWPGFAVLLSIGILQSMAMIAMSVTLLRITPEQFRGLIMGVRMLAVYGLPLGLLAAGGMVSWFGFAPTVPNCLMPSIEIQMPRRIVWTNLSWEPPITQ